MGYDLRPLNEDVEEFRFGAFSFPVLLEACGYFFPSLHSSGQWYMPPNDYPPILANDGFEVTSFEAGVMARVARNFVNIQRSLPDENLGSGIPAKAEWTREDLTSALATVISGRATNEKWPAKIRADFVDRFEAFANWADRSGGFLIE